MSRDKKQVVFANRKLENDYKRLADSKHPEERRSYLVLKRIRSLLRSQYLSGTRIPENKIPAIYRHSFHIDNLWRLELPGHGTVLYSIAGNEIRIVDIL
jgi:hypothetical protein